jgi:fumarylacetoacetate (FAA) hydrolase
MLLNLAPAKGKGFCTAIGPWLVTPDEQAPY